MNRINSVTKPLTWFMTLLLVALAAGCGGAGQSPILGGGGTGAIFGGAPAGAVIPGACLVAGPKVTTSDPLDGNLSVTTSTTGVAGNGKKITANFDTVMDPATINATTFKLAIVGGVALAPASVSYSALAATFTTAVPLLANTTYLAVITVGAKSATAVPLSCSYAWTFKTAAAPAAAPASVNLGLAAPFGMAATAGITSTPATTTIKGDVVVTATPTCNGVAVPGGVGSAGFGVSGTACGGAPQTPVLTGTVITPSYPDTTTANAVVADLTAAFYSICAPGVPAAACSLTGATNIPAGTTLGGAVVPPAAYVPGTNYFVPGVYQSLTSIMITGDLTLDAKGDPNARFVFQSSSTIGTAAGAAGGVAGTFTRILLVGGAKASNVWWEASSSATLGLYSEFQGNILAAHTIIMNTGATSCGRLLAGAFGAGQFTFDGNVVSVPGQPFAPPAGYSTTCQ